MFGLDGDREIRKVKGIGEIWRKKIVFVIRDFYLVFTELVVKCRERNKE